VITEAVARVIALHHAESTCRLDDDSIVIVDEATIRKDYGWIFFYDSRKHLDTGEVRFALAGNAPIVIEKATGSARVLGTALPVEEYIRLYEAERR
jgi:hypothetical protein